MVERKEVDIQTEGNVLERKVWMDCAMVFGLFVAFVPPLRVLTSMTSVCPEK